MDGYENIILSLKGCAAYFDQIGANVPGVLVNTTGLFKTNVDFLLNIAFTNAMGNPGCTQQAVPFGPAGV